MKNWAAHRYSEARRSISLFLPGVSAAFGLAFAIFASLLVVLFVSGAYGPPLSFLSGIHRDRIPRQQQQPPENGRDQSLETRATTSSGGRLEERPAIFAAASPPPPDVLPSKAELLNGTAEGSSPVAAGHFSGTALMPPTFAMRPPSEVELGKAQITASFPKSDSNGAEDQLLDELLASSVHDRSCLSRYRSAPYRRESPYKPSADLVKSLRRYEALHKSCGPQTEAFEKSMLLLKNPHGGPSRCKYLVWTPENGLGNRMLSLASTFLYALLSDRVLLIDRGKDLDSLFCEPFPGSSWLLPPDFPLKFRAVFNKTDPHRFGNILRSRSISDDVPQPAMVYAHLSHDYDDQDKRFYCEADQKLLHQVPWMVLRSDQYFVPALFLLPSFERRLHQLFPQKEVIFHHLGRYLFHPSNPVWDLIISYFEANLAGATETLGIQLRIYGSENPIIKLVTRQILNCTWGEKLLPLPVAHNSTGIPSQKTVSVLLTSLHSEFLGRLENVYRGFSLGISFHQPSHEERQQTGREAHDAKALAEIFLLSTADTLVTSAWSTFGYVAQGLGGLTPWILRGPVHAAVPQPACVRATSMEPCFHFPPTTTAQQEGSLRRQRSSHTRPSAETEFRGCKW